MKSFVFAVELCNSNRVESAQLSCIFWNIHFCLYSLKALCPTKWIVELLFSYIWFQLLRLYRNNSVEIDSKPIMKSHCNHINEIVYSAQTERCPLQERQASRQPLQSQKNWFSKWRNPSRLSRSQPFMFFVHSSHGCSGGGEKQVGGKCQVPENCGGRNCRTKKQGRREVRSCVLL